MDDLASLENLLLRRCFVEVAYFGAVRAMKAPSAAAHMLAGVGCCGCMAPLAVAQQLLEGIAVPDEALAIRAVVSPASELPYEGFFHLVEAVRRDRAVRAPPSLREVFDAVADELAYVSRRETHRPPEQRRVYSLRQASLAAAVLLRRLTGTARELPGVASPAAEAASAVIDQELARSGGDAAFQR
jgi:hypothetical protein